MRFRQSIEIFAEPCELFDLTQDYSRRLAWDPFLVRANLIGSSAAGIGVVARCAARNGFVMETRCVSLNPLSVCAIEMTSRPWFLRSFAGSRRLDPIGPGRTHVSFAYHLVGRPRLLGGPIAVVFAWETGRRLRALERKAQGESS